MWKDPGYTRQCVEVPPRGSKKLPTPDWVSSEDLRPRRGSTLSAIELPLSYLEVYEMSYLYMEAKDGRDPANTISVFGWILSIEETASGNEAVRITWTPDYWRTYSDRATFGAGRISRCNDATRKRPLPIQPRYRTVSAIEDIRSSDGLLWIIISYRMSTSQRTLLIIPVDPSSLYSEKTINIGHIGAGVLHETAPAPSFIKCMSGALPSLLGIQSTSIDGAWVSPICPLNDYDYYISGNDINCHYQNYSLQKGTTYGAIKCVGFNSGELSVLPYKRITISTGNLKTNDLVTYAIADCYGNIAGCAPYDLSFTELDCILDVGSISAILRITFNTSTGREGDKTGEGMTVSIPLPSVPISSSSYSDYVYSGQRDYEMDMRSLQNEQTAIHGASGAIGGAVMGAVAGSILPVGGTIAGAVAGATAGGVTQLASAGITYAIDEYIYKDKFQDLEDKKYSNQSGNLMIPSDGYAWMLYNIIPKLISMTADTVFQSELANHILQEGYPCDSPVSDVTSFITSGGPIQIFNMIITGPIPPEAKTNIKNILSNGVRIVEKNPTGVNP